MQLGLLATCVTSAGVSYQEEEPMRMVCMRALVVVLSFLGGFGVAYAQNADIGKDEYVNCCASCHGISGKGDGPVAAGLKRVPADLTKLSERNNGVFPVSRIYEVIDGRFAVATHGNREMPIWGEIYKPRWDTAHDFAPWVLESLVRLRILALVEYISTLQAK